MRADWTGASGWPKKKDKGVGGRARGVGGGVDKGNEKEERERGR